MKAIAVAPELVAYCGLYCGACPSYRREHCSGCHGNDKATWCKVRACCIERGLKSCADCTEFSDPGDCQKFHSVFSMIIGMLLRSDRRACVLQIKQLGLEGHARAMTELGRPSMRPPRNG
jgi:hypothetical protein